MNMRTQLSNAIFISLLLLIFGCNDSDDSQVKTTPTSLEVRGWNILSDDISKGRLALDKAEEYGINHLQLSHQLVMDLKDVRNPDRLKRNFLINGTDLPL